MNSYNTYDYDRPTSFRAASPQEKVNMTIETDHSTRKAVNYDTENHFAVLTQMHGSVWPKVFPYCILNVMNVILVLYLKRVHGIDLSFSDRGHTFMSMMVSFLVVTRSNITYSRFMEARTDLTLAMKSCRELIQYAITFTRHDRSLRARQWRYELARRTIVLLRIVVSVLEYPTSKIHAWKVPELTNIEKQALLRAVGKSNERTPVVLAMFMRSTIASQVECLEKPMHVNKELRLHHYVSDFDVAYHGLMKLVTTPMPFPLVQMARTFLFIWIFTLPWVLVGDVQKLPAIILIVFFITYAFVGLEFVSIELDDPFGNDPNDFDVLGLARVVFEDIYVCILDVDGDAAAQSLKNFVEARTTETTTNIHTATSHKRLNSVNAWSAAAAAPEHEIGFDRSNLLSGFNLMPHPGGGNNLDKIQESEVSEFTYDHILKNLGSNPRNTDFDVRDHPFYRYA